MVKLKEFFDSESELLNEIENKLIEISNENAEKILAMQKSSPEEIADYFWCCNQMELGPVTITKEEKDGKYYFVLEDRSGIIIKDSRLFNEDKLKKESERIITFLAERGYQIINKL